MTDYNQPIIVNLPDGQNTLTLLQGEAPRKLDERAPVKIDLTGTIDAPLRWLEKRVETIDQHKAYIVVNRDNLSIALVFNEDDAYRESKVRGILQMSDIFKQLGINADKAWEPEKLGKFLKLNRTYFPNKEENREVVNALKTFTANVNQDVQRESKENGNRSMVYRQAVDSNIPATFRLRIPIFSGEPATEIVVETNANLDGSDVTICLQSAGAIDAVEDTKNIKFNEILNEIRLVAPDIVIIEQ